MGPIKKLIWLLFAGGTWEILYFQFQSKNLAIFALITVILITFFISHATKKQVIHLTGTAADTDSFLTINVKSGWIPQDTPAIQPYVDIY